jgi:ABC-type polysaccharide/polyol phosphate transport system ATPase subunit
MADDVLIRAEGLGKKYLIGHQAERERYVALRDVLARGARNLWRKSADMARGRAIVGGDTVEEFWALRDVSFEVKRGEVLGIIGRNGAGKSTLLKILSRITEPSAGRVTIKGRVASLLEVGTGFHPELTGRENIYLNGAILGMSRADIRKKFDEIVAFAEVEKFLDTPVKRYSSGMYVRLAFAVAAHLEPEILVVDEVLAVGDVEFQKKCLGKMGEVSRQKERTVLFVSHNLAAIAELADRVLLLNSGCVALDGAAGDTISLYLSKKSTNATYIHSGDSPCDVPHIGRVEVLTSDFGGLHHFGEPLEVKFWVQHPEAMKRPCLCFQIFNQFQNAVVHAFAYYPDFKFGGTPGCSLLICHFPKLRLNVGEYSLRTWLQEAPGGEVYETLDGICPFEVARVDQAVYWGWRAEVCAYFESFYWTMGETTTATATPKPEQIPLTANTP